MLSFYLPIFTPRLPLGRLTPPAAADWVLEAARPDEKAIVPDLQSLLRALRAIAAEEQEGRLTPGSP